VNLLVIITKALWWRYEVKYDPKDPKFGTAAAQPQLVDIIYKMKYSDTKKTKYKLKGYKRKYFERIGVWLRGKVSFIVKILVLF
jgi:hypothetical protein